MHPTAVDSGPHEEDGSRTEDGCQGKEPDRPTPGNRQCSGHANPKKQTHCTVLAMGTGERITLIDAVLDLARSQLGVHEATGRNDGVPSERYMQGRKEPWCSHFVCFLYRQCGAPIPGDLPSHQGNPLASVLELAHVYEQRGWLVRKPERGGLLFLLTRGQSDAGPGHHVALIERVTDTTVHCLSGNWAQSVARHAFVRDTLVLPGEDRAKRQPINVMGYGMPMPEPDGWRYAAPTASEARS